MVLKVLEFVLGGFYGFKVCVCRFFLPQARRSGRLSASSQRSESRTGAPRSKPEETPRSKPEEKKATRSKPQEKKRLQSVAEESGAEEQSSKKKRVSKK